MEPCLCSGRDNGRGRGCLDDLRLFWCGNLRRSSLGSGSLSSGVLEGLDGSRFLNLRGVLLDLGRGVVLSLGLRLEEVTNAGRKATADLGLLLGLLLFVLLLLLQLG